MGIQSRHCPKHIIFCMGLVLPQWMQCYMASLNGGVYQDAGTHTYQWPISFNKSDPPRWFNVVISDIGKVGIPIINKYGFTYLTDTNQYSVYAYGVGN